MSLALELGGERHEDLVHDLGVRLGYDLPAGGLGDPGEVGGDELDGGRLEVLGLVKVSEHEDLGGVGDLDVLAHGLLADGLEARDVVLVRRCQEAARRLEYVVFVYLKCKRFAMNMTSIWTIRKLAK